MVPRLLEWQKPDIGRGTARFEGQPDLALYGTAYQEVLGPASPYGYRDTGDLQAVCPTLHAGETRGGTSELGVQYLGRSN